MKKYLSPIIIILLVVIVGGYYWWQKNQTIIPKAGQVSCDTFSDKFTLDLEEQAMGHEAIMKNAAETNYIIGTYAFAYWPDDFPLTKEYNVRGKPAEKVITKWYSNIR